MNIKIDNICNGLNAFAQNLKQDATAQIKEIPPRQRAVPIREPQAHQQSVISNPERPWIVAGGTALAVGVLGAIFSNGSWSYVLGGMGVVSILYGQSKKRPKNEYYESQSAQPMSEPKGYEVAGKIIEISKIVEKKWRDKVEESKSLVQQAIEDSNASLELKDSLMGKTYTTERISIDFDDVVSRLDSQPSSTYPSILSEYGRILSNCIDKAAYEQIAIYKSIAQKL